MERKDVINNLTLKVIEKLSSTQTNSQLKENADYISSQNNNIAISNFIDHTLLRPDATKEDIKRLCEEAKHYFFHTVCVNSCWVEFCVKNLRGSGVKVCAVVGFPLGAMDSRVKAFETQHCLEFGAHELDMVINVGALKSKNIEFVLEDIRSVKRASRQRTIIKVIIESCLLSDEEKQMVCEAAIEAEVDYIQTATGYSIKRVTFEDVANLKKIVGDRLKIKAAGGIHSYNDSVKMIQAGASRIGTSSGVEILNKSSHFIG